MNTLEQISIRSPADKDETCAKFVIDDISFPFVFHGVTKAGQKYTLGFYVKSETSGTLTIFDKVYNTNTEWQKLAITFDATDVNIPIFFSTLGTYYFYHTQLEIGNKDTDFELAPEDIERKITAVSERTAELTVNLNSINSRVAATETTLTGTEIRVASVETLATQTADKFNWLIAGSSSQSSLTLTEAMMEAVVDQVVIKGPDGTKTIISGGAMNIDEIFAYDITATGTIMGAKLVGATGSFTGDMRAKTITAYEKYSIYAGEDNAYTERTVIATEDWGDLNYYSVSMGLPNDGACMSFTSNGDGTSSAGLSASIFSVDCQLDILSGGLLVRFGGIDCWENLTVGGRLTVDSMLTSAGDTSLQFPIGDGNATTGPYVQLRKTGNTGNYSLGLVYYDASGNTKYYYLVNADGSRGFAMNTHTHNKVVINNEECSLLLSKNSSTGNITFKTVDSSNSNIDGLVILGGSASRYNTVYAVNGVKTSSDERDKNIIELDERYKSLFMNIRVVGYTWKNDDGSIHIGVSAQQTEQALATCGIDPNSFGGLTHDYWEEPNPDGRVDRYSVNYDEIAMLMVPVVQSHDHVLRVHEAKFENMEAQIEAIKVQLDEAHNKIAEQAKIIEELRNAS